MSVCFVNKEGHSNALIVLFIMKVRSAVKCLCECCQVRSWMGGDGDRGGLIGRLWKERVVCMWFARRILAISSDKVITPLPLLTSNLFPPSLPRPVRIVITYIISLEIPDAHPIVTRCVNFLRQFNLPFWTVCFYRECGNVITVWFMHLVIQLVALLSRLQHDNPSLLLAMEMSSTISFVSNTTMLTIKD